MLGFGPLLTRPIAALPELSAGVYSDTTIVAEDSAAQTLCAATAPFINRSSDTPANQPFMPTLELSLRVDRSIARGDGYGGFAMNISELSLINADGEYDDDVDEGSINGQDIVISIGEMLKDDPHGAAVVAPFADFETVCTLKGQRWWVNRQRVTLEARDLAVVLDVPVQTSLYAGTGELEGGEEIKGRRRPYGDGEVFNATPTLVIAAEAVWQCNAGEVDEITAVRDGGIALEFDADYGTVALLRAATLVPGEYATCNAEGYFRLGGSAIAQITCDFTGLNSTTADIIEAVALSSAGLSASDLDAWAFEKLNVAQPADVNYYLDSSQSETCAEMFTKLMGGIGGWWQFTTLGKLQVHRFEAPEEIASEYYDTNGYIRDIDRIALPEAIDPPPRRRRVAYGRNFTVQATGLYGQVSEDDPAFADRLGKAYLLASTSDDDADIILADYPYAPDPDPVEAYFVDEADAQDEADRLLALYSSGFKPYRFTVKNALFLHQLGEVVNVTDSRLGLSDGKFVRLVEVNDDLRDGVTEMVGFG